MCVTLTESVSKKCSCKFAHLCKARRKSETLQKKLETELDAEAASGEAISLLTFNYAEVKKHDDAEEGEIICSIQPVSNLLNKPFLAHFSKVSI